MNRRTLNEKTYRGYELSDSPKTKDGFFTKTLDQIINLTESMVKMHSKTIAVRIDIHNAQDFENPMTRRELTRIIEKPVDVSSFCIILSRFTFLFLKEAKIPSE